MGKIENLLSEITLIREHYDKIASLTGENFNLFKILKLTTNEVRTHSAFIAELLNPKGNHGQKSIYLEHFINIIKERLSKTTQIDFVTDGAVVKVEPRIGLINSDKTQGGNIDILITDINGLNIIIENKINAGDQENQLIRYSDYAKAHKGLLLYLNLGGRQPSSFSTEDKGKKIELINEKDYFVISYSEHILCWLEKCHKESSNFPIIRESIQQYIHLIKHLTGKSINKIMGNDIIKDIIKDIENYDAFLSLQEINGDKVREILLDKLIQQIESYANKNNMELKDKPKISGVLGMDDNFKLLICDSKQNTSIVIGWEQDGEDIFYYGINTERKNEIVLNEIKTKWEKTFGKSDKTTEFLFCSKNFDCFQSWRRDNEIWKSIINNEMFDKIIQPKIEIIYELIKDIEGI
jgi:hypothetical protein